MVTILGWLSALVFSLGMLSGGHIAAYGLTITAQIRPGSATVLVNPYVAVNVPSLGNRLGGVTFGDTSLIGPGGSIAYEHTHTAGWDHFGLAYPLHILAHPCEYDPAWNWSGHCANLWPTWSTINMAPEAGAVVLHL